MKNALRTDVVSSTAANKLQNGATVLDDISVSGVSLKNANAGTYSFTTGTVEDITGQLSRASSKYFGTVGADATQSIAVTVTSSAAHTVSLSGVYEAGDVITISADDNTETSTQTITYTVIAEDLTLNGDGTGGSVAGGSSYALNNIANKLADIYNSSSTGSIAATATASGSGFSIAGASLTTSASVANRSADQRDITIAADDIAEGNRITLSIAGKDYTVVAGSESSVGSIATALQGMISHDYASGAGSSVTAASGVIHLDWDGLSTAEVS
ncbi:hypothetical protein GH816_09095, partial [Betaproteobacteria bacterium LSUCC0115]|nr:hypothetical protein [Burkholderiales bacterium LSUCC0115]